MGISKERLNEIGAIVADPRSYGHRATVEQALAELRAEAPVAQVEIEGYDPFWIVSRQADVLNIGKSNASFLYGERPSILSDRARTEHDLKASGGTGKMVRALTEMDAPDHMKYRLLTQSWFQPKNLKTREEQIRVAARAAVDKLLAQGGECDFVEDLAAIYPLHIVMSILGVPAEDEPRMLRWSRAIIAEQDPDMRRTDLSPEVGREEARMQTLGEMFAYYGALTEDRRAHPRDDVASVISNAQVDGALIGDREAMAYYTIIATAGHDTTAASSAGAVWAMADDPALFARVKADLSLIPGLVDEAIRYVTPVQHFMRTVANDLEFEGRAMRKGDWVMLSYLSGNRDEAVFDAPEAFDISRSPNRHIAFGYGAHVCLGQHLAKLEMRILLEELLPRIASLEFTGTPTTVASHFVAGPKRMPMRIRPS